MLDFSRSPAHAGLFRDAGLFESPACWTFDAGLSDAGLFKSPACWTFHAGLSDAGLPTVDFLDFRKSSIKNPA